MYTQQDYQSISDIKKKYGFNTDPLCGWEWAIEHQNIIPVYEVQLTIGNNRYNIKTSNAKTLRDVIKINK